MKLSLLAGVVVLLTACSTSPSPSLPTLATYNGFCRDIGLLNAKLAGSPTDPRVTWVVHSGGRRSEIIWPPGFTARFDPDVAVLDRSGKVVYRAGDKIDGGCVAGPSDDPASLVLILPPGS